MPVTIQCPFCDFTRELPDTYSGTRVKCPKCRSSIPYQQPKAEEEKPQRRRAPAWMVVLLVVLAVAAVIVLGGTALLSMRAGE